MDHKPFSVVRLPREDGTNRGPDKAGDWFAVSAEANQETVTQEYPQTSVYITAIGRSVGARREANKLCDMLNRAWDAFHNGDEFVLYPVPKKADAQ